jgi:PAS domain S-box-containing protein
MKGKNSQAAIASNQAIHRGRLGDPERGIPEEDAEPKTKLHLAHSKRPRPEAEKLNPAAPPYDSEFAGHLLSLSGRDIVLILSLDGRIVEANQAAVDAYRYERNVLLSKHIADLRSARGKDRLSQQLADAQTKHGTRFETMHRRADGSEFPVEVVSSAAVIGEEKFLLSVVRDITDRKRTEREFERQASLLDLATDSIFAWYLDSGIVYWNKGAERLYGFSREEAVGHTSHLLLKTRHPQPAQDFLEQLRRERMWMGELRQTTKSGRDVVVESRHQVLEEADGRLLVLESNRDITERKEAEAALALSEEKLRISLEAAQMGTWDWDVLSNQLVWDDRCKALFGVHPKTPMTYERFLAALHPDDRARVDEAVQHTLARDLAYDVEMRVVLPRGAIRWIRSKGSVLRDAAGNALRMSGCALDVTDRKEDEQALFASEERFRLTFDQAAVGITHVALDGRWLRVNQKICEITGFSRAELLQTNFQSITHPDDLQADLEQVRRLIAGEIDQYGMEKRYIRRDGSTVWVEISVSLMRSADGKPDHFITVIADISSRKLVEAELQERRQELEQAQRVGGLGSWSWDPATNRVVWSRELYQIAGWDPLLPPPSFEEHARIYSPESWARLQTMVQGALQAGAGYESDLEMIRPDSTRRWIAIRTEVEVDWLGQTRKLRGTVLDITERKQAEEALRKAHSELEDKVRDRTAELAAVNQSLRVLTGRLLQLQDDERRRISRDLHDSAGQMLVALGMNCAALEKEIQSVHGKQVISDSKALISQMSSEIRTMSYLLHPPLLDEVGLESALKWYVDGFSQRSGIETELDVSPEFGRLTKEKEITLFRVVQEALTNVLRHSGSGTASVRLLRTDKQIQLEINDAGKGIPLQRLERMENSGSSGVGLGGMRERISQLRGEFNIASDDHGTEIVATLPVD